MNINHFKEYISQSILGRGYDYYNEGNIIETYHQGDSEYIFQVQGRDQYEVVVKVDKDGEILYSHCDCPYYLESVCKHQVASYFKLFEILNSQSKKELPKQPVIKEVLNQLSKEELTKIIEDLTNKDKVLKNSLIVKYSKGDDTQKLRKCKELIDSIVRKYTGREGIIKYRETYGFASEMGDLFEKVTDTDNVLLALDIAFLVLEEAIEAFQYADDSNGEIGSLVTETIELIEATVIDHDELDHNLREKVFNKLLEQTDRDIFDGWEEYKIDLLNICAKFSDVEMFRNKLRMKLEYFVDKNASNKYMKYSNESVLQILFNIIEEYGTKEEAEQFLNENLKFTSFREIVLNKYIQEKNHYKVIELALEGEKQDKEYAGLVSKWKKIRYTAYKELSLKEEQEKLAKELLFDGDFEFYQELKELCTGDTKLFYHSLKQELKKNHGWQGRNMYRKLIVEENDLDEIMEFVRENPRSIEQYAERLVNHFKDEVVDIYKKYIHSAASSSSNRKNYQDVCRILKRYNKIAGNENQQEMIKELNILYKHRPAFVDELSKIN